MSDLKERGRRLRLVVYAQVQMVLEESGHGFDLEKALLITRELLAESGNEPGLTLEDLRGTIVDDMRVMVERFASGGGTVRH